MKCWTEMTTDAYSYFQWFSKDEAQKSIGHVPKLSVFSMIASMTFTSEDRELFTRLCSELLTKVTIEHEIIHGYRFYLFGVTETNNLGSKVFKYQKLWKRLEKDFTLEYFILGPEVQYVEDGRLGYAGIAEFGVDELHKAIQITSSDPQKFAIIGSKRQDYRTEAFIKSLLKSLLKKAYIDADTKGEIDYFKLSLTSCPEGDLVFRWGDSSEEYELDIIAVEESIKGFDGVSFTDG